ncbi:uncharacterized protein J7T54_002135 [Emericellopsis cladophorae]|uniref:Uncharacterized protein n=1 Tax=Emericellopsis cladophorae TaxID=2686198 RepID=A0A9Q0BFT4_9HYPO|nr:uncharacterized protein J7T54_002135 [Emericellopsis cladophorae]KAI6782975.1 hypothetical protein J7T54_002135 [Emericellopsis cladophorae]
MVHVAVNDVMKTFWVTPGSPCSSVCLDDPDLDDSDPESSNTTPEDIDSGFEHGHESDQQWFFYNLRFAVNYCVLGDFNATDIEAGPCATKESCGALDKTLSDGLLEPAYSEAYDYCDASNSVVLSSYMDDCVTCVHSFNPYMANSGCEQKPLSGTIVGLNETIFTTNTVLITDPSTTSSADTSTGPQDVYTCKSEDAAT